tara:strand:- start:6775 stop:7227 length:453 start_codon:yes stop_codon:yes gene_type:complete
MKFSQKVYIFFIVIINISCAAQQNYEIDLTEVDALYEFSSKLDKNLSNIEYLEREIIQINSKNPSIQRIVNQSDIFLVKNELDRSSSELERALRISINESAVYLRLAHIRFKQGLFIESKSFAERGLLQASLSNWEELLLKAYAEGIFIN